MVFTPEGYQSFGKNANCTLDVCDIRYSILAYQPSVAGNSVIMAAFGLSMIVHIIQGIRWRSWDFMACMVIGCIDEIVGYGGRVMMHQNPFSFAAFVIQTGKIRSIHHSVESSQQSDDITVCITTAPVFYCSAIYVMLSRTYVDSAQSPLGFITNDGGSNSGLRNSTRPCLGSTPDSLSGHLSPATSSPSSYKPPAGGSQPSRPALATRPASACPWQD